MYIKCTNTINAVQGSVSNLYIFFDRALCVSLTAAGRGASLPVSTIAFESLSLSPAKVTGTERPSPKITTYRKEDRSMCSRKGYQ